MIGPALTLAAFALLGASPADKPASVPEDVTLAAPPFETHGFSKRDKDVSFYSEHFAARLSANGLQVITPQQISSVKEMDKLRQLAGCPATSADCIIELGHMLGAQGVVRGTLAKVGELFQVDVRVYQSSDGKVVAARSVSARSTEALLRALDLLAAEIAGQVKKAMGPPPAATPTTEVPGNGGGTAAGPLKKDLTPPPGPPPRPPLDLRTVSWIPATGGIVLGVGGAIALGFAQWARSDLTNGTPLYDAARAERTRGELLADVGTGLVAGGAAALLTAGAFQLFGAPRAKVSVAPSPGGATVEVTFP